jgi:hypothetical protein
MACTMVVCRRLLLRTDPLAKAAKPMTTAADAPANHKNWGDACLAACRFICACHSLRSMRCRILAACPRLKHSCSLVARADVPDQHPIILPDRIGDSSNHRHESHTNGPNTNVASRTRKTTAITAIAHMTILLVPRCACLREIFSATVRNPCCEIQLRQGSAPAWSCRTVGPRPGIGHSRGSHAYQPCRPYQSSTSRRTRSFSMP